MQIDPTGKWVLVGVEAHEVSSFLGNLDCPRPAVPLGYAEEEASIIIKPLHRTLDSAGERERSASNATGISS
jgi:hypothetical protein